MGESLADCLYKCTSVDIEDFETLLKEDLAIKTATPKAPRQQRAFLTTSNGTILLPYDSFISHRNRNQHSESEQKNLENRRLNASLHQVSLQITELILQKSKDIFITFLVKIGLVKKLIDHSQKYEGKLFSDLDDETQCNILNRSDIKMSSVKLAGKHVAIR